MAFVAVIVVAILVFAALVVAFVPFQPVNFSQSNEASAANIDALTLVVTADVANVNVMLRDLPGNQRAATNISATGWRGIFGDDKPLALAFDEETSGSTLTYLVNVSKSPGWSGLNVLNVTCAVYVDPSVNLGILVHTNTGAITINADRDATFEDLVLQATTGSIVANLRDGTIITNRVVLEATTGSVQLFWNDAEVSSGALVDLRASTSTGSVELNVTQTRQLQGNVTLNAETSTGGVNLNMGIQIVGARISASTSMGGINVNQKGFSGNQVPIQSNNYPAASDFDITLRTSVGGININAHYELGGTLT